MTYIETYFDFNLDQLKNQDTPVCFAFNNPELNVNGPVRAMIQKSSRDLKCFNSEAKTECSNSICYHKVG